jgi:hypothetical protein
MVFIYFRTLLFTHVFTHLTVQRFKTHKNSWSCSPCFMVSLACAALSWFYFTALLCFMFVLQNSHFLMLIVH